MKKAHHKKNSSKDSSCRESSRATKSYNMISFLIISILVVSLIIVAFVSGSMDKGKIALYVKPANCGSLCNEGAVYAIIKSTGRSVLSYEADFVKSPLVLVAKEDKLNLISAQSPQSLRKELCDVLGGSAC